MRIFRFVRIISNICADSNGRAAPPRRITQARNS
jgi:hypothetical protein